MSQRYKDITKQIILKAIPLDTKSKATCIESHEKGKKKNSRCSFTCCRQLSSEAGFCKSLSGCYINLSDVFALYKSRAHSSLSFRILYKIFRVLPALCRIRMALAYSGKFIIRRQKRRETCTERGQVLLLL